MKTLKNVLYLLSPLLLLVSVMLVIAGFPVLVAAISFGVQLVVTVFG
jgi:hypothetical protein